jgi:hypothetical protein
VGADRRSRGERLVLWVSCLLMWIPCVVLLIAGAPLLIGAILATSAGTMTIQVAGTATWSRFGRWAERLFRN